MEFVDRYIALGIPYPDVNTVCKGHCEGTGMVPLKLEDDLLEDPQWSDLWLDAHMKIHTWYGRLASLYKAIIYFDKIWLKIVFESCDGWHFVRCPDCRGTGKR